MIWWLWVRDSLLPHSSILGQDMNLVSAQQCLPSRGQQCVAPKVDLRERTLRLPPQCGLGSPFWLWNPEETVIKSRWSKKPTYLVVHLSLDLYVGMRVPRTDAGGANESEVSMGMDNPKEPEGPNGSFTTKAKSLRVTSPLWYMGGGFILFLIPSIPAARVAAVTRYGLQAPPGMRFSIRVSLIKRQWNKYRCW